MPQEFDGQVFLNTNETIARLGVSRVTLDRYVQEGLITKYKKGFSKRIFFLESDVEDLRQQREEYKPQ